MKYESIKDVFRFLISVGWGKEPTTGALTKQIRLMETVSMSYYKCRDVLLIIDHTFLCVHVKGGDGSWKVSDYNKAITYYIRSIHKFPGYNFSHFDRYFANSFFYDVDR